MAFEQPALDDGEPATIFLLIRVASLAGPALYVATCNADGAPVAPAWASAMRLNVAANNPEFKRGSDAGMKTLAFANGGTVGVFAHKTTVGPFCREQYTELVLLSKPAGRPPPWVRLGHSATEPHVPFAPASPCYPRRPQPSTNASFLSAPAVSFIKRESGNVAPPQSTRRERRTFGHGGKNKQ